MREIKFRAWVKPSKGHTIVVEQGFMTEPFSFDDFDGTYFIPDGVYLDNLEVMQFTGLKDKNGKEIYEGDIFKDILDRHIVVEWQDELGDAGATYGCGWNISYGKHIEVIGNIYENPNLLSQ